LSSLKFFQNVLFFQFKLIKFKAEANFTERCN
jgi:hypothetical protein